MSIFEAIILGIIQGLTEFLPVSSSGHLEIAKAIFGSDSVGGESMLMTVVLHFATALSTVVIFRKDILQILKGLFQFKNNEELKFSLKIVLSMIPAALVGILLKDEIESLFGGSVVLVGFMLIVTGLLLFLADKAKKTDKEVGLVQSIIIGISQAIAILPGISRSGATISTSVLLGIDREKAARFSFLMVVPLILGAMAVDTKDYLDTKDLESTEEIQRTNIILDELKADQILNETECQAIFTAVYNKEIQWSKDKNAGKSDNRGIAEQYTTDLKSAGINEDQIRNIMSSDYGRVRPLTTPGMAVFGVGFIFAFMTGLFACRWMISLVKRAQLKYFSFYCFLVGAAAIIVSMI